MMNNPPVNAMARASALWIGVGALILQFVADNQTQILGLLPPHWAAVGAKVLGLLSLLWYTIQHQKEANTQKRLS